MIVQIDNTEQLIKDALPPEPPKAEEPKVEEVKAEAPKDEEAEDENGLTEAQKKELTEKIQRAIGKKHRQMMDAEEYADAMRREKIAAERRAAELERELNAAKAEKPQKTEAPQEPNRDNFKTEKEYLDAMVDWRVDQKFAAREAEQREAQARARQESIIEGAKARIAEAKAKVEDWEDTVMSADVLVPPMVMAYIQKSPMIAELTYYLAKHPSEVEKLQKLDPDEQLVAIGEIKRILEPFGATPKVEPKASNGAKPSPSDGVKPSADTTAAPVSGEAQSKPRAPVIKPLATGSAAQVEKDESEMSTREAIAAYAKRNQVNFSRRQRH